MRTFFSNFEENEEFKQAFAQYEEMKAGNKTCYFDADQLADFAEYYGTMEQYTEAFEVIDYALSIHPANTEVLVIKAHILIELERIEEAKEIAYSIPENYVRDVKMLKAELLILEKNIDEAKVLIQEVVSQEENNDVDNWLDIAYMYTDSDFHEEAMPWYEKIYNSDPENYSFRFNLAECYALCKQEEKGVALFNQLIDKDPYSVLGWFELGRFYYSIEEYNKSLEAYEFALTIDANHPGSVLMTAHGYYKLENYEKSREYYEKYDQLEPSMGMAIFFIGLSSYNLKEYEKAITTFNKVLDIEDGFTPPKSDIYSYISLCYNELKQLDKAIEYSDLAIQDDPSCIDPYLTKGQIYLINEENDKALECFDEAIKLDPHDPRTFLEIGIVYFKTKKYDLALKCFQKVELFSPEFENNYLLLAYANGALGKVEEFKQYILKAIEQNPNCILDKPPFKLSEDELELRQLIIDVKKVIEGDQPDISNSDLN
jgi:tetratricopeptide (TPR) repeat protein